MISLVPLRLSHAVILAAASKDPLFLRGLLYEQALTRAEAVAEIRRMLVRQKKGELIVRSIEHDGTIIGRVGAGKRGSRWFLFYWVIPEHQRKGFGTEAVKMFLQLAPRPLYAEVFPWNEGSKKVLQARGAKKSGEIYRID